MLYTKVLKKKKEANTKNVGLKNRMEEISNGHYYYDRLPVYCFALLQKVQIALITWPYAR